MTNARLRTLAIGVAVAVAYVATARLGFTMAFVAEQVTTVWVPTGLAQAVLLLRGLSLWPAILIGAFAANVTADVPLWAAAVIASGNTLEAVAAAGILLRIAGFDRGLRRTRDALAFILIAAIVSPAVSATVGVSALSAAGVQPWTLFPTLWTDWWLGDAIGAIVVGPLLLTLARGSMVWTARTRVETAALVAGTLLVTHAVFGPWLGRALSGHPLEYVIFPLVITAAVRQGQPATAFVVLSAAVVAIWHTVRGSGPFAGTVTHDGLVLLQLFMGVIAATGLLLAAATAERQTSERRRAAAHAVSEVLAEARSLAEAAPTIVRGVCETLNWSASALWVVDAVTQRLRCIAVWPPSSDSAFAADTRERLMERGVGLPGRVWASGTPLWIENLDADRNFPRAAVARREGLRAGFAFPIRAGDRVIAVMECFSPVLLPPDPDLMRTMSTVGNQLGQFVVRTQVEAAAAEAKRRTDAILETALDAIIGMDARGTVTEFNPAAERMFGYSAADAIGRELADLIIPAAMREGHRAGLRRFLATGEGPFIDRRVETSAYHADGREFPVEVAITRVPGDDSPRFTGFVRDLTARVQAERERERLLERELTARQEAEAANRAKDDFLATLSHELRTPLNVIVGWTRMLRDGSLDGGNHRRALEVIERNAQLQTQLVEDILDMSGIVTGRVRLEPATVDLGGIVSAAVEALGPSAGARAIALHTRVDAAGPFVSGDAKRLQQIVRNLVVNAIKFTPDGGRIDVVLSDTGAGLRLTVTDNGAGIAPDFLPLVFERFRQADGSVSRQHGGLGLGLAIVRHLVELHGGRVSAESAGPGQGATFTVDLPKHG